MLEFRSLPTYPLHLSASLPLNILFEINEGIDKKERCHREGEGGTDNTRCGHRQAEERSHDIFIMYVGPARCQTPPLRMASIIQNWI